MIGSQSARVTQVDPDALHMAASRFGEAASLLAVDSEAPAIDPGAIGHEGLSAALAGFVEAWTPAVRGLAAAGSEMATRLEGTRHAYLDTDQSLIRDAGLP